MEIHPHHLQKSSGKKWSHYLFEFFMLFLAVFAGFLAENWREDMVEHQREKQFIISMVKELESDTSQMNMMLQDTVRPKGVDSLVNIIYAGDISSIDVRMVYYLRRKYTFNLASMLFSRNTLTQLKNGGNMRLIRNRSVVDSLNRLDNLITQAEGQLIFTADTYHLITSFESGIFNDGFYRDKGIRMPAEFLLTSTVQPVLLTKDYNKLIEYANMIGRWRGALNNYQRMVQNINYYSAELIEFLQKQYHLK